ncbi:MAG: hypothetical protein U0457_03475 [Candidatus Sericytochromatia bacterium]
MEQINKIFKLYSDPKFNILNYNDKDIYLTEELNKLCIISKFDIFFERVKISDIWKPINITFTERDLGKKLRKDPDFIEYFIKGFSKKALESLKDLIPNDIEILPVNNVYSKKEYFFINIPYDLDCLGEKTIKDGIHFERYDFNLNKLDKHIFTIKEDLMEIYVTDIFVKKVLENKLKGFGFSPVWIKGDRKIYKDPFVNVDDIDSSDESTWKYLDI